MKIKLAHKYHEHSYVDIGVVILIPSILLLHQLNLFDYFSMKLIHIFAELIIVLIKMCLAFSDLHPIPPSISLAV